MKCAKRVLTLTIIFLLSLSFLPDFAASAAYKVSFEVNSKSAYLINTDTGTVIYEKNAKEKNYPASLTKIMTAIIAMEHVKDLEGTMVTASPYIFDELYGLNASTADIRPGEQVNMLNLLYALILPSACEAGSIIADFVGEGSIPDFVDMMNAKAAQLGATDTHFVNAHGLFNETQVTTAYDMYLITKYALTFPIFEKISSSTIHQMPASNKHAKSYNITHTNAMLSRNSGGDKYYYKDMKGVKTGTLDEVGRNLVSTASRDGYNYMLITLGAPIYDAEGKSLPTNKVYEDARALYDWAFTNFSQQKVLKQNEVIDEIPVKLASGQDFVTLVAAKDVIALLPSDVEISAIQQTRAVPNSVNAPVEKGAILGTLELKLADEVIATVDLVAMEQVDRSALLYALDVTKRFLSKPAVMALLGILVLLILLYIVFSLRYKKLKRKRATRARERIR